MYVSAPVLTSLARILSPTAGKGLFREALPAGMRICGCRMSVLPLTGVHSRSPLRSADVISRCATRGIFTENPVLRSPASGRGRLVLSAFSGTCLFCRSAYPCGFTGPVCAKSMILPSGNGKTSGRTVRKKRFPGRYGRYSPVETEHSVSRFPAEYAIMHVPGVLSPCYRIPAIFRRICMHEEFAQPDS